MVSGEYGGGTELNLGSEIGFSGSEMGSSLLEVQSMQPEGASIALHPRLPAGMEVDYSIEVSLLSFMPCLVCFFDR